MIKTWLSLIVLCWSLLVPAWAEEPVTVLPGVEAAAKLSELTGIAINPLVVGGGIGAWHYWRTPEVERAKLHWTAQPWFWGPLLSLGLLFLVNGTLGRVVPPTAKFMDAVETLEGKLAPLYASAMVIPVGIQLVQALERSGATLSPISRALAANGPPVVDPLDGFLGGGLGLLVFGVIWLTNQAIHAIVLICPFGLVSAWLRLLQLTVLGLLVLAAAIHPMLGAAFALVLIIGCALIAGWSFRLSVFGCVLAWDLCFFRSGQALGDAVLVFAGRGMNVAVRTLGWLERSSGRLELVYRPWLILPRRRVPLPDSGKVLTQGVFFSQIHQLTPRGEVPLLLVPPRYRGSEAALAKFAGCEAVRESPLRRGVSAVRSWLRSMINFSKEPV